MNFNTHIRIENESIALAPLKRSLEDKLLPIVLSSPILLKYSPSPFGTKEAFKKIGAIHEGALRSHTLLKDGYRRNTTC